MRQWKERYENCYDSYSSGDKDYIFLRLDEVGLTLSSGGGEGGYAASYRPGSNQYTQLYVPYDYFERACKAIKSVYSDTNGYAGYHNYMKYWARNGHYNWICNQVEYLGGPSDGKVIVDNTYLVTNFWNSYDGTQSPVNGVITGDTAYGWR